ncbi:hypothetical protein FQA47_003488 [Oryzias melastigma]|uniref:Uncharacterized protein n=1 Tax=Oryzias melastigma TaxID=30732 RepID=A0A834C8I3_ORYME|nr:hypothetical protein FQA47_003488 [Oryzias melastigma]
MHDRTVFRNEHRTKLFVSTSYRNVSEPVIWTEPSGSKAPHAEAAPAESSPSVLMLLRVQLFMDQTTNRASVLLAEIPHIPGRSQCNSSVLLWKNWSGSEP